MPPDVLLDLTPLETSSRYRGIGRYVRCLAASIASLAPHERAGLEVSGLRTVGGRDPVGPLWPIAEPTGRERETMSWIFARRSELVLTLRRVRPRLFHATQPLGTPRGAAVPRVVTCHDLLRLVLHEEYMPGRWIYRHLLRAADVARFHAARRVIAISRETAGDLVRLLGVPAKRIDVIHHGVEPDRFHPPPNAGARARARARRDRLGVRQPYFFYLGGGDPRKSLPHLCRAFASARLDGVELVLAGKLSETEQRELDAALGGAAGVRQLGYVDDDELLALLWGALALAFPSIAEGFGLPVLEAMAAGCPVVTTTSGALAEVAGDAALLVPPRDDAALAAVLRRVASEASLRADLERAGLAHAARFTWRATALATLDCYARALR